LDRLEGETLPCQTVIVGEGPERESIEKFLAVHPRVAESVRLAGFQPNIRPYLTAADVFVLPSHSEGSPNALLEAMAAGLPIVATTAGGIKELVSDPESAYLSPPRDTSALSKSIQHTLADLEEARTRGARAKGLACSLTPQANVEFLICLYEDILSTHTAGAVGRLRLGSHGMK
jgi:L-malate glycosyltransferase